MLRFWPKCCTLRWTVLHIPHNCWTALKFLLARHGTAVANHRCRAAHVRRSRAPGDRADADAISTSRCRQQALTGEGSGRDASRQELRHARQHHVHVTAPSMGICNMCRSYSPIFRAPTYIESWGFLWASSAEYITLLCLSWNFVEGSCIFSQYKWGEKDSFEKKRRENWTPKTNENERHPPKHNIEGRKIWATVKIRRTNQGENWTSGEHGEKQKQPWRPLPCSSAAHTPKNPTCFICTFNAPKLRNTLCKGSSARVLTCSLHFQCTCAWGPKFLQQPDFHLKFFTFSPAPKPGFRQQLRCASPEESADQTLIDTMHDMKQHLYNNLTIFEPRTSHYNSKSGKKGLGW